MKVREGTERYGNDGGKTKATNRAEEIEVTCFLRGAVIGQHDPICESVLPMTLRGSDMYPSVGLVIILVKTS